MDRALIETAVKALGIRGVYLRGSHIRCKEGVLPPYFDGDLNLTPQFRGKPDGRIDILSLMEQPEGEPHRVVLCHFQAGVRLVDNASVSEAAPVDEEAVYLEITADFSAEYDIRDGIEDETLRPALEEFARHNLGHHIWPYWREYVQGTCARMGIPPIPIPMYLLKDRDTGETSEP
ncbi:MULTISPECIES: hypothetical protein [unclassified Ectothiorhodospira]|uniref:hypothetical protein n=1 Tax=unclassified Ectothiorhodospira TaxID=2684909 RepID=UPI001EE9971B|nr:MULTISPECIES: hypothetical protein [unclassified Ectothiorhodospira]MCG5516378.1 hypothetical protein [Ectothiorhodospira sp. 9100]MCG5519372.1 hypothetical protein [Ectothiorhodospira sp. 9905]